MVDRERHWALKRRQNDLMHVLRRPVEIAAHFGHSGRRFHHLPLFVVYAIAFIKLTDWCEIFVKLAAVEGSCAAAYFARSIMGSLGALQFATAASNSNRL
jgi:hypothetical protein